ncbi:hypothetical protein GQ473_07180 [archaeon]|nr:hypothetical protein [archaeon]
MNKRCNNYNSDNTTNNMNNNTIKNLRKNIIFISICLIYILFIITPTYAQELIVEKHIKELPENLKEGEKVTVMLKITNPFDTDLPIKIVDKNIFANNGLDIECLEQIIPKQSTVELEYTPITAYVEGKYTLEKAKITYNDTITKNEIEVESNTYDLRIEKGTTSTSTIQQGITTINKCDGKNTQSTSYSSQSSNSQEQKQKEQEQQQNTQNKLNNINQENSQNMQNLQKEMQEEAQKQAQQKKEMEEQIESNKKMYNEHKKLEEEGYKLAEKNITPESNNSGNGDFEYKYQKENGDKASITGNVNNKNVENISSFSSNDERRLMKALENNTKFNKEKETLEKEGFELQNKSITPTTTNMTNYNYQFSNPNTNETAQIYGNITKDENVTSVIVEKENNKKFPWVLIYLAILLIAGYYYWSKYIKKPTITEPIKIPPKKPINYHKKALSMLNLAEKTYEIGNKKEAYEKASYAVRYFYKYKFESDKIDQNESKNNPTKKELTGSEVINISNKKDTKNKTKLREFFNITNLVNFAKYKPNDSDFNKILKIGNDVIGK